MSDKAATPATIALRLTVNLTRRATEALDRVANDSESSKTDTVNRALLVQEELYYHQRHGGHILLQSADGQTERLRLLF